MPQFSYKARRRSGEVVEGVLDVADRSAALVQIQRLGLFPVMVDAAKGAAAAATPQRGRGTQINFKSFLPPSMQKAMSRQRRPKLQELATFTQQLANLLNSGMPLTVALQSMTHLESKGIPSSISRDLRQEVMEGRSLSDSMAKQPVIFSDLYVNMVRAGEQSGALVQVLRRMAQHFQQFAEVQSKFTSALVYPAMVCIVGILMVTFFMFFMLPKFMAMFQGFDIALPLPTRILMGFSHAVTNIWAITGTILGVAVLAILIGKFRASEQGRRKIDEWKMKAPIFGKVVRLNLFGQFARVL
ncbi:MAG TPA: type II secretion system F family protein, partial [Candidatus Polarisedimenticolia bacterium]|nr:type II secretion system F family protein [Candidatus Polarisedimenticolia bacterium]